MTHINNLDTFLADGFLYAPNYMNQPQYSVSYAQINQFRGNMTLGNGRALHDYVPFYFSPLTPMAFTISQGNLSLIAPNNTNMGRVTNNDIVFIGLNLENVYRHGYQYQVSNSACNNFAFATYDTVQQANINWNLFNEDPYKASIHNEGYDGACRYFHDRDSAPYQNRRAVRGAEFLIADRVDMNHIDFFIVKNDTIGATLRQKLANYGLQIPVYVEPDCYY
ncbi:DarT ssDNA thymidine ADP-ribosyltransferase family protein [Thiomicrorhabdus sp. zzn3]|nr:DarT ssDNA thymidine ADP-ribosyltransferase family protein [Thiomicrorhabdus sp. zzn3]MDG6777278.1 DarT ssDNA thymidine ADP-ribosyltransferase family protein [Thiomicrorhabdus sp. zzn3]